MHKLGLLLQLTSSKIPWALARFNDGEIRAMTNTAGKVARGDQKLSADLMSSMRWAIAQRQENLFMGLPCSKCYPAMRIVALTKTVDLPPSVTTAATVLTNRNLKAFKEGMAKILNDQKRPVHWFAGEDQDVSKLPFHVETRINLPLQDAYGKSHDLLSDQSYYKGGGDVTFLSCGPLATIIAVDLFKRFPFATFIDVGSVWDPETRGVRHRCHTGRLPACAECN